MLKEFTVEGMHCAACSSAVEKCVMRIEGVSRAEVSLLAKRLVCECDASVSDKTVISAIEDIGFSAKVYVDESLEEKLREEKKQNKQRRLVACRLAFSAALLAVLMYVSMGHMLGLPMPSFLHGDENAYARALAQLVPALIAVVLNYRFFTSGVKALVHGAPNMDTLVSLGSGASLVWSLYRTVQTFIYTQNGNYSAAADAAMDLWYESAVMILVLVTFGKWLEEGAEKRAGAALEGISKLAPDSAIVLREGKEITVKTADVVVGDLLIVRPGERVAADGVVEEGYSSLDESALTGESMPCDKAPGDSVLAASANISGRIAVRVHRVGKSTTLAQISELVGRAAAGKAPIARLADKVSGIFVPVVMSISVLTFIVWMICGGTVAEALNAAISVLVISCPCALGLATPVAVTVGCGHMAEKGVLLRSAKELETLAKVDLVVFDKTGTLTEGRPEVKEAVCAAGVDEGELLCVVAALEAGSAHPLAKAVVAYSTDKIGDTEPSADMRDMPGRGICGTVEGSKCYAGSKRYMTELGVDISSVEDDIKRLTGEGLTLVFVAKGEKLLGVLAAGDTDLSDSKKAIEELHALGVKTMMLSGDNKASAVAAARRFGIDADMVRGDLLPGDKEKVVSEMRTEGRVVMMVGDGINDAPALASADIGAAVYGGTDIAANAADILLMKQGIATVPVTLAYGRRVLRVIKQNLFWAFFYNTLGIPVAAGVLYPAFGILLTPMIASAAMTCSSLFVVTNALRLRKDKR
ncbi:MAG: copper-translocating P-type ATPase [Clostridia bacterium]|nr:copper-translocating P-type ATPase [Clostridia bacterium]